MAYLFLSIVPQAGGGAVGRAEAEGIKMAGHAQQLGQVDGEKAQKGKQQDLFRVLKAYTLYRPEEGYCQAQAPIAAVLLMHMPAEVR
ncbi:hypothetical protein L345_13541, partial [Ophiophagus hannah]